MKMRLFRITLEGVHSGDLLVVPEYAANIHDAIEITTRQYAPHWRVLVDEVVEVF